MRFRRDLIGVVLAFVTAGTLATGADATAYQKVYDEQDKQEQTITQLSHSEFISSADKTKLANEQNEIQKIEKRATRRSLTNKIQKEKKLIKQVKTRIAQTEATTAQTEFSELEKTVNGLTELSQKPFTEKEDKNKLTVLKQDVTELQNSKKVAPIRELTERATALNRDMKENQADLTATVSSLKQLDQDIEKLSKKSYLLKADKEKLAETRKTLSTYFKNADSLAAVHSRETQASQLLAELTEKQETIQTDFKKYESKAKNLLSDTKNLSSKGNLTADEKKELNQRVNDTEVALKMQSYAPGDLGKQYDLLNTQYRSLSDKSKDRQEKAAAEAERKAAEKEKARQTAEKEAQQQAEKDAAKEAQQAASQAPAPSQVGEWYQAPAGYKYLKVDSGKTYGQVKIPSNFQLITDAEAANHSPGHGNGWAKQ